MILITGDCGFIGTKLKKKISKEVYDIFAIDLVYGEDLLTCELPNNIDLIYHLAAQSSVEESWKDPILDSNNIQMTIRLAIKYPKTKIIYAQSSASLSPITPYGLSKKTAEDYLTLLHKNVVICVFPNVYGGGNGVVDLFKGKDKVVIYGDGNQIRDFVHVDDIVDGLIKARSWKAGKYFMGSGKGTKIKYLARGKKVIRRQARKEIKESILSNTTPNWKPKINVYEYIKS